MVENLPLADFLFQEALWCLLHQLCLVEWNAKRQILKAAALVQMGFLELECYFERFRDHAMKSPIHSNATLRATQFRSCMENKLTVIDVQYSGMISKQVEINGKKLQPIIEAIILCGRKNIALRGDRDDDTKNNPGNLQAMLEYLVRCGNNTLFKDQIAIANAPKSATFHLSKSFKDDTK